MQKLTSTWNQQKSTASGGQTNFSSKQDNGQPKLAAGNQGKRRLGRFPISATSVIVNKGPAVSSISVQKGNCVPERSGSDGIPASFLSSFSASIDNDLIMEVEKMEAALCLRKEENKVFNKKDADKSCSSSKAKMFIEQETKKSNLKCSKGVASLKRLPRNTVSESCGKRKHVKTLESPRVVNQEKESATCLSLKGTTQRILESVSSPICSPMEKRLKSNVKSVKKAAVVTRSRRDEISVACEINGTPTTVAKSPICTKQKENTLTSSSVAREEADMSKSFDFSDISFSPLCTTPVEVKDKHNLLDNHSSLRKSMACRDLKLSPNILNEKCVGSKSNKRDLSSSKKQLQTSVQKQEPNASMTSSESAQTPVKSGVKNSFSKKKRPSPTVNDSPDVLLKKKDRKAKDCVNIAKNIMTETLPHCSKMCSEESVKAVNKMSLSEPNEEDMDEMATSKKVPCVLSDNISERESLLSKPQTQSIQNEGSVHNSNSTTPSARFSSASSERKSQDKKCVSPLSPMGMDNQREVSINISCLTQDKRELSSWGLPEPVLEAYKNQGVSVMFQWQAECLLTGNVLDGGNLVYSAPTSAGKTLVAELLLLKRVVETRTKALFILPFVSVAREKMYSLQRLYQDAGIRVGGYMGSYSPPGGLSNIDVAVCTIEKGNSLINRLMEEEKLSDLGAVIIDELHMVGDSHRGYLLELMLTKLAYISSSSDKHVQVIGMSATLPNLSLLAKWLNASLYHTEFRPVPLYEHIKVDSKILDSQLLLQREIPASLTFPDDKDHVIALCLETVSNGNAALVFCPTKNWCEKLCETIARRFYALTHQNGLAKDCKATETLPEIIPLHLDKDSLMDTVEQLKRSPAGVDPMLGKCVLNGVAYHHAGLTFDERDIIEGAFRQGQVKVLVATSTLSSGVNLPARRVIIRTPMFHGGVLDIMTYKQMSGRAGRKGIDSEGESILICKPQEKTKGQTLLTSELPPVESCLRFNIEEGISRSLKRAILEVVVSGVAETPNDVISYVNCTLLSASLTGSDDQETSNTNIALVESCIKFLQENEFVTVQMTENEDGTASQKFYPTQLGLAVLASSLSPDEGLAIFAELQKARRSFVLDTELHIIYLVTPVYTSDLSASIDWYHFHTLWETLTPADRRVAELVGVSELFITRAIKGRVGGKTEAQKKSLAVHCRFYTALVLNSLVQESPLTEVASKFNCNKGQLQSLQQSASTYAGMITVFCERLGWHNLQLILSQFQKRLSFGVQQELVDLVRISSLNASSARMLYNAGYHTVAAVARADELDVENLFKNAVPFQSEKKQDGETDWEVKERRRARCIWLTGRKGVTELDAALAIIEEAKVIVQGDLGISNIAWGSNNDEDKSSCEEEERRSSSGSNLENCKDVSKSKESVNNHSVKVGHHCRTRPLSTEAKEVHKDVDLAPHPQSVKNKENGVAKSNCKSLSKGDASMLKDTPCSRRQNKSVLKRKKENTTPDMRTTSHSLNQNDSISSAENPKNRSDKNSSRIGNRDRRSFYLKNSRSSQSFMKGNISFSKSREKSFFGQTVVSPPIGVREKGIEINNGRNSSMSNHSQTKTDKNSPINVVDSVSSRRNPIVHDGKCGSETFVCDVTEKVSLNSVQDEAQIPNAGDKNQSNNDTVTFSFCDSFVMDTQTVDIVNNEHEESTVIRDCKSPFPRTNTENLQNPESGLVKLKDQIIDHATSNTNRRKDSYANDKDICVSPDPFFDSLSEALENDFKYTGTYASQNTRRKSSGAVKENFGAADLAFSEALFDSAEKMPVHGLDVRSQQEKENVFNENTRLDLNGKTFKSKDIPENIVLRKDNPLNTSQDLRQVHKKIQDLMSPESNKDLNFLCNDNEEKEDINGSLIAASNYERLENSDEELMVEGSQELSSSYADLHIIPGKRIKNMINNSGSSRSNLLCHQSNTRTLDTGNNLNRDRKQSLSQVSLPKEAPVAPADLDSNLQCQLDESALLADLANDSFSFSPLVNPSSAVKRSVDKVIGNNPLPRNSTPYIANNECERNSNTLSLSQNPVEMSFPSTPVSGFRNKQSRFSNKQSIQKTKPTKADNEHLKPINGPCSTNDLDEVFADSFTSSFMDKVLAGLETHTQSKTVDTKTGQKMLLGTVIEEDMEKNDSPVLDKIKGSLKYCQGLTSRATEDKDNLQPKSHNSSKNDGSDCVPPTPPDESTSLASPFKFSFSSPLKSNTSKFNHINETSKEKPKSTRGRKISEKFTALKEKNVDAKQPSKSLLSAWSADQEKCAIPQPRNATKSAKNKPLSNSNNLHISSRRDSCLTRTSSNSGKNLELLNSPNMHLKEHSTTASSKKTVDSEHQTRSTVAQTASSTNDINRETVDCDHSTTASQLLTQQSFTIIDVCANKELFQTFLAEWKTQSYFALSVACEKNQCERKTSGPCIGGKFVKKKLTAPSTESSHSPGIPIPDTENVITGISISWENRDSYFVSFRAVGFEVSPDPDDTLAEPPLDETLTVEERVEAVWSILNSNSVKQAVAIYDTKPTYVCLAKTLGVTLTHCEDPRVADWLREPSARQKNLHHMVASYCSDELSLLDAVGGVSGYQSMGSDVKNKQSSRLRACTESVLVLKLMRSFHTSLRNDQLLDAFIEVEIPALVTLARMELNGFGVSEAEFESQKTLMTSKLTVLEEMAYQMAGHVFSITSTDDVAKVLYIELKLPINGDPSLVLHLPRYKNRGKRTTIGSTNKEILEKLQKFHPLPGVILEWRRISSALTKSLFALQRSARLCSRLDMSRVFGECQIFTATGRVSMMEPNLQNIPKDFTIDISDSLGEVLASIDAKSHKTANDNSSKTTVLKGAKCQTDEMRNHTVSAPVSMRNIFVPFRGGVILAADYSQLELRIIAHLSGDVKLGKILNTADGDVFKMIAAQMKSLDVEEVTAEHRQQAKQVCYGMLYGIGPKALGEQLEVDENEAGMFMETFKSRYPGIRKYLRETVEFCQKNGFVKTMFNRRRYLPSIKHKNPNIRAQAERQAVNTTIQGSAADLVKIAMTNIDSKLMELFTQTRRCHAQGALETDTAGSTSANDNPISGAFLVLQLHDELIYEVSATHVSEVARLVKYQMETAVKLIVSMPVKVKVGPSWGQLQDYEIV